MTVAGRRAASTRSAQRASGRVRGDARPPGPWPSRSRPRTGRTASTSWTIDADLAGLLVVDAAAHEHDRVGRRARPRRRRAPSRRPRSRPCPRGRRASRTSSSSPLRVRIFLDSVIMPPTFTHSPSLRSGTSAIAQSALTCSASRTRLSGCSVMKRPIDSFSIASSSWRSNSSIGIGGCDGRGERVGRRRRVAEAAEVEDRALADLRRPAGRFWPAACAESSTSSMPLARRAGGAEGAALDQRLDRALVDRAAVHALAEVPQRRERRRPPRGRA